MAFISRVNINTKRDEFIKLWGDPHATKGYIRERIGCSYGDMEYYRREWGLPDRPNKSHAIEWEPTEEQVAATLREIQAGWSDERRLSRETGESRQSATLKHFIFDKKSMSFK